jgi:hypothetical protein
VINHVYSFLYGFSDWQRLVSAIRFAADHWRSFPSSAAGDVSVAFAADVF